MDSKNKYSTNLEDLEREVEVDFFKSSGPGGQNVNKRETAVRLRHIPSGIVIEAQSERTQGDNRRVAFERLESKLKELNKPKKRRVPTKVSKHQKEKRLEGKHRQSEVKESRKKIV